MDRNDLEKIIQLRHKLHMHAELSLHENETKKILMDFIRQNTSMKVYDCGKWFYAVKTADPAEKVRFGEDACTKDVCGEGEPAETGSAAFCCDMDALPVDEGISLPYGSMAPGVSHKCGHDGHSAVMCGLALELERLDTGRDIYLIFQHAEETGAGAQDCCSLITEKGIKEIYAFHNLSGYPENTLVYRRGLTQPASEGLRLEFHGRTSHAGAPEDGCNPAEAVCRTALFATGLASGKTDGSTGNDASDRGFADSDVSFSVETASSVRTDAPGGSRWKGMLLCTIAGIDVGNGDFGVSAGEGSLSMTIRAENEEEMNAFERAVVSFAGRQAEAFGLEAEHVICDRFPETRNDDEALDKVLRCAGSIGVSTMEMDEIWRPSEDFGHYLKLCSGAMFYIGNGETYPALHTREYDFNDGILETTIGLFTAIAAAS